MDERNGVKDLHISNKFQLKPDGKAHYGNVLISGDGYFYLEGGNELEIDRLEVKKEYDTYEFTRKNLCIMNVRGGEYTDSRFLFLRRKYWLDAMKHMRGIRPDMEFAVVTDDVAAAGRVLPGIKAYHSELAKDYVMLKNAEYLILSNSSFGFFPAFTSETVKKIIAPKYWARHNVSDGYWASGQNIYEGFLYMDRQGKLFDAEECRMEWEAYKESRDFSVRKEYSQKQIRQQARKDRVMYLLDKAGNRLGRRKK